jgi:hypothetical protein
MLPEFRAPELVVVRILYMQALTRKMSNVIEDNDKDEFANGQRCGDLRDGSDANGGFLRLNRGAGDLKDHELSDPYL